MQEKTKVSSGKVYGSRKAGISRPRRNRDLRFERSKKPNRPVIGHQIKHMNRGLPYRHEGPPYRPDEVLVKFKPTLSAKMIKATIAAYQGKELKRIPRINVYKIKIQTSMTLEETLFALRRNPDVEYAEPNYITFMTETPNDSLLDYRYAL